MNPLEMIKPATTGGFSFLELFLTAHPVVKFVMIGLLLASVWAWAIIIEKLFAFRRARREADRFEQMFWSGQSLDELYTGLAHGPHLLDGLAVRCRHARVEALGGRQHPRARRHPDAGREGDGRHHQPRDGAAGPAPAVPGHRRLDGALRRPVRHGVGHHDELPGHRHFQEHQPCGGGARHRRSAVCHRARPAGRHTGGRSSTTSSPPIRRGSSSAWRAFADEFSAIVSRQIDVRT